MARLWKSLPELRLLDLKRSGALTQMIDVHRTMVIRSDKSSQLVHDASFVSFVQSFLQYFESDYHHLSAGSPAAFAH